jgi:hypothetical protein
LLSARSQRAGNPLDDRLCWHSLFATLAAVGSDLPLSAIIPTASSTQERLISLIGGLKLFWDQPVFGASLGPFRDQMIPTLDERPLVIHSTAVWLSAELGAVGLLVFSVPFIYVFQRMEICVRRSGFGVDCFVLCSFRGYVEPGDILYQRTFWFLIGAALAFRRSQSNQQI